MRRITYVVPFVDAPMAETIMSRLLQEPNIDWTILCFEGSGIEVLRSFCCQRRVPFETITRSAFPRGLTLQNTCFLLSWSIYQRLKDSTANEIRFADHYGSGFHCIQAKRTGAAFDDTVLSVELLGSTQYLNEIDEIWGYGGFDQLMTQYMERYCCQHCDDLLSLTAAMLLWAEEKRWELCPRRSVQPLVAAPVQLDVAKAEAQAPHGKTLIYCGPLSKAGGLVLFIRALRRLHDAGFSGRITKVIFVGEWCKIEGTRCDDYLRECLSGCAFQWEIAGHLLAQELVQMAYTIGATVVFTSSQRLLSPALCAAAANHLPIIAVDTLAHREIFAPETLSDCSPALLAAALLDGPYAQLNPEAKPKPSNHTLHPRHTRADQPLVSICTAFYNHGKYLDSAQVSIEKQDYENIEWIVVDDGSTDMASVQALEDYRRKYVDRPYHFLSKANEGPSIARNHAAKHARGEYLLFMDSDNVAMPHMVSAFVRGMEASGCDCLSSFFDQFTGEGIVDNQSINGITYALLGSCAEIGAFMNCFGDTNFIIKRDVFEKVGGFLPQRVVTEDWQILTRLVLQGYSIDVIPEALFWYRVLPQSNVSFGSEYYKQQLILETYCRDLPPHIYHIFNSLCRPSLEPQKPEALGDSSAAFFAFIKILNKLLPLHSRRRALVKRIARLFLH